jgi:hypothetical protein
MGRLVLRAGNHAALESAGNRPNVSAGYAAPWRRKR